MSLSSTLVYLITTFCLLSRRASLAPQTTCHHHRWRQLDVDQLREQLRPSIICQTDMWPGDIGEMAAMYESELSAMLDRLIPFSEVTCRPSMPDPWFDKDCLEAKCLTRRLDRAYLAACRKSDIKAGIQASTSVDVLSAKAAWYARRRVNRELRQSKCSAVQFYDGFNRTCVVVPSTSVKFMGHPPSSLSVEFRRARSLAQSYSSCIQLISLY